MTVGLGDVVGVQRVLNPARKVTCECSVDEKSTEDRRGRVMSPKTMNVIMAVSDRSGPSRSPPPPLLVRSRCTGLGEVLRSAG